MEKALNQSEPPRQVSTGKLSQALETKACQRKSLVDFFIQRQLVTAEQVTYAQRVQARLSTPKTLVQVLFDLGSLEKDALRQALHGNPVGIRIGDLLVELGYLRENELSAALERQKVDRSKKLGEILVENRFIEERVLLEVLSYQLGLKAISLAGIDVDRDLFARAPAQWYLKHKFVPIAYRKAKPFVVFADPTDQQDMEVARNFFGQDLVPGIATAREIIEFITKADRMAQTCPDISDETGILRLINSLLEEALTENSSNIHLEPMKDSLRVRLRCDGVLRHHKTFPLEACAPIVSRLKVMADTNIAERRRHQQGRILYESPITGRTSEFRVSFFVTTYGETVVLRLMNGNGALVELKDIGILPKIFDRFQEDVLDMPSGVLIVTGPTGSGKTTSLYGCVNYLNSSEIRIATIENPVEYILPGISQCSINPQAGLTLEESLKHIIRQDPDVIVLGETDDKFSASTAIQSALTGHRVLTTFYSEDAASALFRLINMDIEPFLISSTVSGVLAQRLLRKICPKCAEPYQPTPNDLQRLGINSHSLPDSGFMIGRGCIECRFTGNLGRMGVFELLVLNEHVKDAILQQKPSYEIRRTSIETTGMLTLTEDGLVKASQGLISIKEVIQHLPRIDKPRPIDVLKRLSGVNL